jgi:uncharacterized protein (TIGR00251 family)
MNGPRFLSIRPDGVCLSIKVQPRAARNEIVGVVGDELKVRVTAPPVDSAANEAVLRLLAEILGCARSALHLQRGQTSRRKLIKVAGLSAEHVLARLRQAGGVE